MGVVSIETLAALAEQGGASEELVAIQFAQRKTSPCPDRVMLSEQRNASCYEEKKPQASGK